MDWIDKLVESADPLALFDAWFSEAKAAEPRDPEAMTLATIDPDGCPNLRTLLMRGFGEEGFLFHSNALSAKGLEMSANPKASMLFYWKSLARQVRLRGSVKRVDEARVDAYFAGRPYGSQIGAWASEQSQPLESRAALVARVEKFEARYREGEPVPRPSRWVGYCLQPVEMEFWWQGEYRLHDRVKLTRKRCADAWRFERLNP